MMAFEKKNCLTQTNTISCLTCTVIYKTVLFVDDNLEWEKESACKIFRPRQYDQKHFFKHSLCWGGGGRGLL